jgi:hypothetical protein
VRKFIWRQIAWLIVLSSFSVAVIAQDNASSSGEASYLMRLERLRRDQDVCVLVRGDGQYHSEVLYPAKTEIFEGVLREDELRDLVKTLSQDRLFQLQQKDIRTPLLASGRDQITLSVLRPGYWQNLSFPSAESRASVSDLLDPLLKWLDEVRKRKGRRVTEESGRNNCNPPRQIQLTQRAAENPSSGPGDSGASVEVRLPSPAYVVRMVTTHLADRKVEDTCLIVFETGAYHWVQQSQKMGSNKAKAVLLDGSFSLDDIRSLRAILDRDELQKYSPDSLPSQFIGETTITHLTIPRSSKPQQTTVWKNLDPRGLGAAHLKAVEDHGTNLVKPLNEWLKTKLADSKNERVESSDPPNPKCLPTP